MQAGDILTDREAAYIEALEDSYQAVMARCQQHDPATGYFKSVTPYEIVELARLPLLHSGVIK